jgi:hypothetical protein
VWGFHVWSVCALGMLILCRALMFSGIEAVVGSPLGTQGRAKIPHLQLGNTLMTAKLLSSYNCIEKRRNFLIINGIMARFNKIPENATWA